MKKRTSNVSRRIVSLLMSLVLTLTLVTPAAFAEGMGVYANGEDTTVTTPIGGIEAEEAALASYAPQDAARTATGNQDWTAYAVQEDTENPGVYRITKPEELAWLAQTVNEGDNTFADKTVKLEQDIDLSELCYAVDEDAGVAAISWTPIGDASHPFKGTFDGGGHIISGLYIGLTGEWTSYTNKLYQGLFGRVQSGTVRNLIVCGSVSVVNAKNKNTRFIGGVVGDNAGTVQNCGFYGAVTARKNTTRDDTYSNGGVVGNGNALNCWYYRTNDAASKLGVCGSTATNCYHNVQGNYKGTYVAKGFVSTAVEKLNAALKTNDIPWKDGGASYPQFLAGNERLLTLKPLLNTSAAKVLLDGKAFQTGIVAKETVTLTGEGLSYRLGETGDWTKIGAEGAAVSLKDAGRIVTIYYASDDDFNASKWYEEHKAEKTFTIRNASELAYLAQLVNTQTESFSGKTVVLGNDIDLSSLCHGADEANGIAAANWTPIGSSNQVSFAGTLDGKGHTISSLYIQTDNAHQGLFGYLSGSVRNLIVTGTVVGGSKNYVAGIAGELYYTAKLENCGFYGSVTSNGYYIGGVAGNNPEMTGGCWYYYTGDQTDGSYAVGVWGDSPRSEVYGYHNVNNDTAKTQGTYIPSSGFAAGASAGLNVYAFQNSVSEKAEDGTVTFTKELYLWKSVDGTAHPVFDMAADRSKLTVVGLAKCVERSTVEDQVKISITGGAQLTSCLADKGANLTLTLAEGYTGDAIYFTDENASVRDLKNLKEIKADGTTKYTIPAGAGEAVTLYYGTMSEFSVQDGVNAWYYNTKGTSFNISEEAELRFLTELVNEKGVDFKGWTVNLKKDIELTGDWTPIGTEEKPFRGNFYGANAAMQWGALAYRGDPCVIKGLKVSAVNAGLFGVTDGATIRFVDVEGGTVTGSGSAGGIVGWVRSGSVEYCLSTATVSGGENAVTGGLVGRNKGTVTKGYYYNETAKNTQVAGGTGTVTNSFYLADSSTFGAENDAGARTAAEFAAGRVVWELSGKFSGSNGYAIWRLDDESKRPALVKNGGDYSNTLWEMTLEKTSGPENMAVKFSAEGYTTLTEGNTQYIYIRTNTEVSVDASGIPEGYAVRYSPKMPTKLESLVGSESDLRFYYNISHHPDGDISWYVGHESDTEYTLLDAADLYGFVDLVHGEAKDEDGYTVGPVNFKDKTVKLAADIDVSGYDWTPVGDASKNFKGTFDGTGHTITATIKTVGGTYTGLFGYLYGTVCDLTLEGTVVAQGTGGTGYAGGIAAYARDAGIRRCVNRAAVTVSGYTFNQYVGGIVGCSSGDLEIKNCLNEGNITVTRSVSGSGENVVGGIAGSCGGSTVTLCWNKGDVTVDSVIDSNYVGGVAARGTVRDCANFGTVRNSTTGAQSWTGGIGSNNQVENSYNLGDVTGAEGKTFGISGHSTTEAAENNYYICSVNGAAEKKYTVNKETQKEISWTTENGVTVYTVGEDTSPLVDELNKNRGSNTPWFVNYTPPAGVEPVYLPRHMRTWNGEMDAACPAKLVTVTYDPNGGINKDRTPSPVSADVVLEADAATGGFTPVQYTVLEPEDAQLGFIHENGTPDGWKDAGGTPYTPGESIALSDSITLYAQWEGIWEGTGTAEDPYRIPNGEKLAALAPQVNDKHFSYEEKWFRLTDDIDLSGFENWTPIGNDFSDGHFGGNLDGNHKSITGLNVRSDKQFAGLFGVTTSNQPRTYQDLKLSGTVVITSGANTWCGGLIACAWNGYGSGIILRNIEADVTVEGDEMVGGLVGRGVGLAENCIVRGSITGDRSAGGIGSALGDNIPTLINCHNYAAVTGRIAAGLWAVESGDAKIENCSNSGTIQGGSSAAGIANGAYRIENCVNSGTVISTSGAAGGITVNGQWVERCGNTASVTGSDAAAGIAANGYSAEFCYNTGAVKATRTNLAYGIGNRTRYVKNCFTYTPNSHVALAPMQWNRNEETTADNSYYLANSATELLSPGEWATLADFASGKVAWGVDGGEGAHTNYWTQDTRRGQNQMPAGPGRAYPKPIEDPNTEFSVYRALVQYGTGGTASLEANSHSSEYQENAVYGMKGTSVTVTATPKDDTFGLKSLTLDLMGTGSTTALESGDSFTLGEANALVVAAFASTGNGGNGGDNTGGNGGDGDGTGTDTGDGAGDENDEGLQDGLNLEVEYDVKSLILSAYGAWGAESSGKTFTQWLKDSPEVLRALITNSLDNMAVAAMGKKTDEAKDLAALLLASLNEHSGLDGQSSDTIGKMLRKYIESGTEAAFSAWLTTGGGMASGTYESIFAQYTNSLLALADRLYTNWESSGTSLTFPQWLDAQQVTMESLSENAEEPDAEPDDTQTTEAPEDVPDGQEAEGGASGGGNSVWEVIGTVVRENPIIVWSIVAVIAALVIVGAVRRYHKVKRDERDDAASKK